MNRMRLIILAAAVVAALLAAFLAKGLLERPAPQVVQQVQPPPPATLDVLVAGKDIAPGELFGSGGLQWRAWPREGVSAEMMTREAMPDALEGLRAARARVPIVAGEPILPSKIVRPGEAGFMSAILPSGMRAISIPITELSSVSGFVLPNDRVDVILTRLITNRSGDKVATGEAVLTNVKVLAINQTLGAGNADATIPDGRTAVLELEPLQAEVLQKIVNTGELSLALRSMSDDGNGKPQLAESYRNPSRPSSGPVVIRYGLARQVQGQ